VTVSQIPEKLRSAYDARGAKLPSGMCPLFASGPETNSALRTKCIALRFALYVSSLSRPFFHPDRT
jgi:hypothetical protein